MASIKNIKLNHSNCSHFSHLFSFLSGLLMAFDGELKVLTRNHAKVDDELPFIWAWPWPGIVTSTVLHTEPANAVYCWQSVFCKMMHEWTIKLKYCGILELHKNPMLYLYDRACAWDWWKHNETFAFKCNLLRWV